MAAGKAGIPHALPLLVLNFVLYTILLGLASWAFNELIDGTLDNGNSATSYLILFSLLAAVLGITSVIAGLQTLIRKLESNSVVASAALAAWGLALIALGLASKQIHIGGIHNKKLRALEAFAIIVAITQFLYLLLLHANLFPKSSANTAPTESNSKPAATV
ncbi:hypothetical protein O6H91_15G081900 [Diphasiastrum complanatum]|uniref:Uncharacterized protein n=3 Tax=Diphasiastrum complanatum TaxID=34168 RepID=A0ACC2BJU3_DIPCM|nr:hypothetical protein O6H91_15G073200 [Diphasiastrum complanatum]KAJ7529973.1 hypothetical protein O6H91_15G073200 [Diphasiastrum complanatum]KAJ7530152.1 hypothetical protein O6H91_15G081900 [Diphasiastrum complanatum]